MHEKLLRAFKKVKSHVMDLRANVSVSIDAIEQLKSNQKVLLAKIQTLEKQLNKKAKVVTKVVEKPKIVTKYKTKVVEKVVRAKKTYVGAKTSMKLHSENCPFAKNINRENKVLFKSKVKPFGLGYDACDCLKK